MSSRDSIQSSLKLRREQRGWAQADVAARAGISRSEVSAIEVGRLVPSAASALRLAQAFGCRVEDLFSLGESVDGMPWAWAQSPAAGGRFWRAEVGGVVRRYPAECLPTGELACDDETTSAGLSRETLVLAVCDPAVGLLTRALERTGVRCLSFVRSSRAALQLLADGKVHVAGVHLGASTEENARVASASLQTDFSVARVAVWEEGLAFSDSSTTVGLRARDLRRMKWVGREPGSGARRCSDALIENPRRAPEGYNRLARDHRGVAEAIRTGWADVGVCVRLAAEEAGLNFKCVANEAYDVCFRSDVAADPRIQALMRCLRSHEFRASMSSLPGYRARDCGELVHIPRGAA